MKLKKLVEFLNKELDIGSIEDDSLNGLQIECTREIKKIGLAVDARMETFKRAAKENVDLLIVHHGLFWNKKERITNIMYNRVKFLMDHNIGLYVCHLPLDKHNKYGNNAELVRVLGGKVKKVFDDYCYIGVLQKPVSFTNFVAKVDKKLDTDVVFRTFGKKMIKSFCVCSGGGMFHLFNLKEGDADVFITGDASHTITPHAEEMGVNLIFAGHYATETWGVKAVGKLLEKKFKLKTVFIDVPTGL